MTAAWESARDRVFPSLRLCTDPATPAWSAPFQPMLHEVLVFEGPDGRVVVDDALGRAWGVDAAAAREQAHRNLAARATEGLTPRKELGLWQLAAGDGYEASRLLLSGWLAAFEGLVPGRPVAIAPAPRVLLVGGDGAIGQIERLVQLGADAFRGASPGVSPVPYTLDERGALRPWAPEGHPLRDAALASGRLLVATAYAAQREGLVGRGPIVAAVTIDRGQTVASWGPAPGGTMLPDVDAVDIEGVGRVPWAAARRALRGALEELPLRPPRWLARWPAEGSLRALRALVE